MIMVMLTMTTMISGDIGGGGDVDGMMTLMINVHCDDYGGEGDSNRNQLSL